MENASIKPSTYASDDSVQCSFYSSSLETDILYWERLCDNINKTILSLTTGHIWHRDEFKVYIPIRDRSAKGLPLHLASSTCFGDNIEDEWFIVYIVMKITKLFNDLIVQIKDNDGDFLLIEAADYLQPWVNPDTTENRVFIYRNQIHLIPDTIINLTTSINVLDALKIVTSQIEETKASPNIHRAILSRISSYPERITENLHRAVVTLPLDVAALLKSEPSLISSIVNAYCSHDMIDAQACKSLKLDNCVTVEVNFTKCLYAMLTHSKLINVNLVRKTANDKRSVIGIKLTCGYEMIMRNASKDIFSTKEYSNFTNSLKKNGYFNDNIEGSKDYKDLLEKANDYYKCIECPINSYVSDKIIQIMSTTNFKNMKESLEQNTKTDYSEDDEDWLNIHPEQLNDMLNSRYGKQIKFKSGDTISSQTITSKLSDFFKQTSDFEGIEQVDANENSQVDFNPDDFVNSIEKMLNILSTNKENDESSDYSDDSDDIMSEDIIKKQVNINHKTEISTIEEEGEDNTFVSNFIKSIKEEEGSSGPSSNLLKTIGINKMEILDSDDDLT
ncbi:ecdysoneless cell cycle regulator [Aphomia sociella]